MRQFSQHSVQEFEEWIRETLGDDLLDALDEALQPGDYDDMLVEEEPTEPAGWEQHVGVLAEDIAEEDWR